MDNFNCKNLSQANYLSFFYEEPRRLIRLLVHGPVVILDMVALQHVFLPEFEVVQILGGLFRVLECAEGHQTVPVYFTRFRRVAPEDNLLVFLFETVRFQEFPDQDFLQRWKLFFLLGLRQPCNYKNHAILKYLNLK